MGLVDYDGVAARYAEGRSPLAQVDLCRDAVTPHLPRRSDGRLRVLDLGAGTGMLYSIPLAGGPVADRTVGSEAVGPVTLAEGMFFVPTDAGVVALSETSEFPVWIGFTSGQSGLQMAVAGGVLYTTGWSDVVEAFAVDGCGEEFQCFPLCRRTLPGVESFTGAPAVSQGQLYVGTSDGAVHAFGLGVG